MANLILLNNFAHDFGAAGWLVCSVLLCIAWKNGSFEQMNTQMRELIQSILILMRVSLFGITVFGVVRMLAYKKYEWSEAAGDSQITVLVVKHILLTAVFVWGAYYYLRSRKALRAGCDDVESLQS